MKDIPIADVRNFVLVGHTGSGKTSLVDALLFKLGANDRLGNPGDGTSMADWTDEEKSRKISIWAKPFDATWRPKGGKALRLVMLDTPGYADFYGQVVAATQVADAALLVVDATAGVQVGTVRAWKRCEALGLPRAIAITGLDKENADFAGTVAALQDVWGARCE
ncbi:MAG TPA: GTP-binding protein, partial [Kiritimatiellia bacterium]|nr:GTP-binding protein [Kiritimatiellia bacterium]